MKSLVEKSLEYALAHNGELPPKEKMNELVREQLDEYLQELSKAVIPEHFERFIITAAYRLIYATRYNMLEPNEKKLCDDLVKHSRIIATESEVQE